MSRTTRVASLIALAAGVAAGSAFSFSGCCDCERAVPISEGAYTITSTTDLTQGYGEPIPNWDSGTMQLDAETVHIEYERPAGTAWTVEYRVTCRWPEDDAC